MFTLRDEARLADLVPFTHIGHSLLDNSTTLLINAGTLERMPHWVDRDTFDLEFGQKDQPNILIIQVGLLSIIKVVVVIIKVCWQWGQATA